MIDWNQPIYPPFDACPVCGGDVRWSPSLPDNCLTCVECGWAGPMVYRVEHNEGPRIRVSEDSIEVINP